MKSSVLGDLTMADQAASRKTLAFDYRTLAGALTGQDLCAVGFAGHSKPLFGSKTNYDSCGSNQDPSSALELLRLASGERGFYFP